MKVLKSLPLALLGLVCAKNYAQELKADLQIRPRYEYTNGFGTLLTPTTENTSFIGNRTRLNVNYADEKLKMKVALQNVRTWGAVNNLQGGLSGQANDFIMFEGWAEYSFTKKFSTKIGRQPLSYDNQRILGGLDWANQGRSFDAALLKYKGAKSQLDLGFSLSSADEQKTSASYPAAAAFGANDNAYKSLQYAWFHTSIEKVGVSLLAVNLGREYIKSVAEKDLETNYYQTFGTFVDYKGKKLAIDFSVYGQTGKIGAQNVSAYQTSANLGYAFSPKFKATVGYEFLSGRNQDDLSTDIKSFNPIFGTNHAFNGYMDYFYVGNHIGSVGLQDISLKLEFPIKKVNVSVTPHAFMTASRLIKAGEVQDSNLGTELDITASYKLYKDITLIGGYSQMFATDSMVLLKGGTGIKDTNNNWAWLMININPQIFSNAK
ncbi:MAG: hypothetical protein QG594_186 [Bacteroidota bacterium]|nr:hypothetical protein [Bacteroidota bacterium]